MGQAEPAKIPAEIETLRHLSGSSGTLMAIANPEAKDFADFCHSRLYRVDWPSRNTPTVQAAEMFGELCLK
jgi:hypothetical protein